MVKAKICSGNLWVSPLVIIWAFATLSSHVQSIAVHPAVLKNFVGPNRVRQGEPILRGTIPFTRSEDLKPILGFNGESLVVEIPSNSQSLFEPQQAALHTKDNERFDSEKGLRRACEGSATCRRNLDSTLNLLMKMMETGR